MADFQTFNLGSVLGTASALRTEQLRQQYLDTQNQQAQRANTQAQAVDQLTQTKPDATLQDYAAAGGMTGVAASQQVSQARLSDLTNHYRQLYSAATAVANSDDPLGTVASVAPQFSQQYDAVHGQGAFAQLTPEQVKSQAGTVAQQALAGLVDPDKQFTAHQQMVEDHYKQEGTGGEADRAKLTQTGEDNRAAAGRVVTMRGQDLEAQARGVPSGYRKTADGKGVEAIPGGPADVSTNWSDEAIQTAGERFRLTGQMPPLGRNGQVIAGKIASAAAASATAAGQTTEAAAYTQIASKANVGALANLTKQQTMVGAFEKTAQANMDLAEQELGKLELSGSPIVNKGINAFRQGVTGDPQTARFVNALTAARTEYAKVLSGATGSTGVTDSARTEANELFNKNMNPDALRQALQVARTEMRNRMTAFDQQKTELQQSITGSPQGASSTTQSAPPPAAPGAAITATGPNGQKVTLQNGQWVPAK